MRTLTTPISKEDVASLKVGDQVVLVARILWAATRSCPRSSRCSKTTTRN